MPRRMMRWRSDPSRRGDTPCGRGRSAERETPRHLTGSRRRTGPRRPSRGIPEPGIEAVADPGATLPAPYDAVPELLGGETRGLGTRAKGPAESEHVLPETAEDEVAPVLRPVGAPAPRRAVRIGIAQDEIPGPRAIGASEDIRLGNAVAKTEMLVRPEPSRQGLARQTSRCHRRQGDRRGRTGRDTFSARPPRPRGRSAAVGGHDQERMRLRARRAPHQPGRG